MGPTTRAYTSYVLATVYGGSFLDGLAAVLPCYWIYARVGEDLLARSSPDPLYRRWIEAYGNEAFQDTVRRGGRPRRPGSARRPPRRSGPRAGEHFVTTARYEVDVLGRRLAPGAWPI